MLPAVRRWLLLLMVGCGFQVPASTAVPDAPVDVPPDVAANYTIDPSSGKACPADVPEWSSLIEVRDLNVTAPDGLWPMQDLTSSNILEDVIGTADLAPRNAPLFRQSVSGWTRVAVGMPDFSNREFFNNSASTLPDVATTSMTILMVLQIASPPNPAGPRSILFGGSGQVGFRADVDLDANRHLRLTINSTFAAGTIDYGTSVFPIVLKLDVRNQQQKILTPQETVQIPYVPLIASRGLVIGGANNSSPDLRCLYLAAWYGADAEISDADVRSMLTAMGW